MSSLGGVYFLTGSLVCHGLEGCFSTAGGNDLGSGLSVDQSSALWSHTGFLHVSETLTLIMAVGGKPNLKPI